MKKLFWLTAGFTMGLVAAKQIEKNPKAKAAYDKATDDLMALVAAFTDGYSEEIKEAKPSAPARASSPKSAK